ncbi:transposase [Runella slithyformis]|uniref:transposase n=1 Tax=Runella slithyformis TaxID=106 RepID=UPI0009D98605
MHRSQAVKDFLTYKKGRVHLVTLPGYSPELNPVELLWSQLKRELKNRRGGPCRFSLFKRVGRSVIGKNRRDQKKYNIACIILS